MPQAFVIACCAIGTAWNDRKFCGHVPRTAANVGAFPKAPRSSMKQQRMAPPSHPLPHGDPRPTLRPNIRVARGPAHRFIPHFWTVRVFWPMVMESLAEFLPPPHNSNVFFPAFSTPSLGNTIH
jgi:hypothetical protein